ncbi:MAG: hypothetical protein QM648_00575 [Solirubrobacterales bacterium]
MKIRSLVPLLAVSALAIPVAASADQTGPSAQIAKKKLSYCQKKGKKAKGKLVSKDKSAKFFLYVTKRPTEYYFCSESPKFDGGIAAWDGIKKTSHLRVAKKNCAVWYSEQAPSTRYDSNWKYVKIVPFKFFRKGSAYPEQTQTARLGDTSEAIAVQNIAIAKNCVWAAAYTKNGAPYLTISGSGDFGYTGKIDLAAPGASLAELKAVKVTYDSPTQSTVSWTQGGTAKTYVYTAK